MKNRIEQGGMYGEDFGALLDQHLTESDWSGFLAEKDFGQTPYVPNAKLEPLRGADVRRIFVRGLAQKKDGSFDRSYDTFSDLLERTDRSGLTRQNRNVIYMYLAHDSTLLFVHGEGTAEKLRWADTAYSWFNRLEAGRYEGIFPQNKLTSAIQLSRLRYDHHLLVDDADQQRELLRKAYEIVESVRKVASSEYVDLGLSPVRLYRYISFAYACGANAARELAMFENEDTIGWRIKAHDLYVESAELAIKAGELKHATVMYGMANELSEELGEISLPSEKWVWFSKCYEERLKAGELAEQNGDLKYAAIVLGLGGKVAQRVRMWLPNGEENFQWDAKAYEANIKAGELFLQLNDHASVARSYRIASAIALKISQLSRDKNEMWSERAQFCRTRVHQL